MTAEQRQFIEKVGRMAQEDMGRTGVLASLTIAQAVLESGWGTSELCRNANALFGIKADGRWNGRAYSKETKECYDGVNYTTVTALFRAYSSWEESIADHSAFLRTGSRYKAVIGETDYKAACKAIKAAGYATDPLYAEKLISVIEENGLTEYDTTTGRKEPTMSNSPLVTYTKISSNKNSPRNHAIDTITIHCIVGQWTAKQGCDYFASTDRQCSANYVVGKDGSIGLSVEEKDRSWCSSNAANDHRAITIEVASDTTPPYAVTDKAYEALIDLVADICRRNGIKKLMWKGDKSLIGQVDKQNMTVHRWFANKACPGDYLYSRHGEIAAEVNKKLGTAPVPEEQPSGSFTVGDIVQFKGGPHYTNASAATAASTPAAGPAKVTAISKGAKHPYHIVHTDSSSSVYGWVNASDIQAAGGSSTGGTSAETVYTVVHGDSLWAIAEKFLGDGSRYTEIKAANDLKDNTIYSGQKLKIPGATGGAAAPAVPVQKAVTKGSTVRLKKGAKTYAGQGLASFVYERDHIVSEVNGDRAVITYGGVVVAAVHTSDLTVK